MKFNIDWKRVFLIIADIALAVYLVMALTSWHTPKRVNPVCTKVDIIIADENENGFLNTKEVKQLLERKGIYPLGESVGNINPRTIEGSLKRMPFVKTAQCYVSQNSHVTITITQRTPLVRVKSNAGDDYYIDDAGGVMPNSQYTSDLLIISGNVNRAYVCKVLYPMVQTIMSNDLWRNQIEQIYVLDDKTIELVPRIGDHIVCIGQLPAVSVSKANAATISAFTTKQLERLQMFYKEGLRFAGWNKYEYIDLQYSNQIVCRKREADHTKHMISAPQQPATPKQPATPQQPGETQQPQQASGRPNAQG